MESKLKELKEAVNRRIPVSCKLLAFLRVPLMVPKDH